MIPTRLLPMLGSRELGLVGAGPSASLGPLIEETARMDRFHETPPRRLFHETVSGALIHETATGI